MAMLTGSLVALITPMSTDGEIDWPTLDKLLEWHIQEGTRGIIAMGTTGESATLDTDEHLQVIKRCIEVVDQRIPVVAGTGSNSTAEAIHQTKEAARLGADACLVVTPYYNRPTQEGLVHHFKAIAAVSELPVILYNVPPRTGCDMLADTVARLAEVDRIVGIKDACGAAPRVKLIRDRVDDDFYILSGEDAQTMRMMELGAVGTISVTANVLPKAMSEFCARYLSGDKASSAQIDAVLQSVHDILFVESSPTPTKWILADKGLIEGGIRLPLIPLSTQHHETVRQRITAAEAELKAVI